MASSFTYSTFSILYLLIMPIYPLKTKIKQAVGGKRNYTSLTNSANDTVDINNVNNGSRRGRELPIVAPADDEPLTNDDEMTYDDPFGTALACSGGESVRRPGRLIQKIIHTDAPNGFNQSNDNQGWRDNHGGRSSTTTTAVAAAAPGVAAFIRPSLTIKGGKKTLPSSSSWDDDDDDDDDDDGDDGDSQPVHPTVSGKKNFWPQEDITTLVDQYNMLGNDWEKINEFLPARTRSSLKAKLLLLRKTRNDINEATFENVGGVDFEDTKRNLKMNFRSMVFSDDNPTNPPFLNDFPSNRFPIRMLGLDVIDKFTHYVLTHKVCDLCGEEGVLVVDHHHGSKSEKGENSHCG